MGGVTGRTSDIDAIEGARKTGEQGLPLAVFTESALGALLDLDLAPIGFLLLGQGQFKHAIAEAGLDPVGVDITG